eukprot:TRINITY_DN7451_c0_g1_i1.p1 TRINITY_DN7451_c0_g1~~TRINITY_DN7451_c0_g1_i1.p1  ORF type:complete len:1147 (+),score=206.56 TRINITY_DN7451_c0_g1_i1:176-3616(+)
MYVRKSSTVEELPSPEDAQQIVVVHSKKDKHKHLPIDEDIDPDAELLKVGEHVLLASNVVRFNAQFQEVIGPAGDAREYVYIFIHRRNKPSRGGPFSYLLWVNNHAVPRKLKNGQSLLIVMPTEGVYKVRFELHSAPGDGTTAKIATRPLVKGDMQSLRVSVEGHVLLSTKVRDQGKTQFIDEALPISPKPKHEHHFAQFFQRNRRQSAIARSAVPTIPVVGSRQLSLTDGRPRDNVESGSEDLSKSPSPSPPSSLPSSPSPPSSSSASPSPLDDNTTSAKGKERIDVAEMADAIQHPVETMFDLAAEKTEAPVFMFPPPRNYTAMKSVRPENAEKILTRKYSLSTMQLSHLKQAEKVKLFNFRDIGSVTTRQLVVKMMKQTKPKEERTVKAMIRRTLHPDHSNETPDSDDDGLNNKPPPLIFGATESRPRTRSISLSAPYSKQEAAEGHEESEPHAPAYEYRMVQTSLKHGKIYRSACFSRANPSAHEIEKISLFVRDDLGVRTVIDFRNKDERDVDPYDELIDAFFVKAKEGSSYGDQEARRYNIPLMNTAMKLKGLFWESSKSDTKFHMARAALFGQDGRSAQQVFGEETMNNIGLFGLNRLMLVYAGESIGSVMRIIADPRNHPVLYHCSSGKDRTGLITALILKVCGVADEDVTRDYHNSEKLLKPVMEFIAEENKAKALVGFDGTPEEVMQQTLAWIRQMWGGIEFYLSSVCGFTYKEQQQMRCGLLDLSKEDLQAIDKLFPLYKERMKLQQSVVDKKGAFILTRHSKKLHLNKPIFMDPPAFVSREQKAVIQAHHHNAQIVAAASGSSRRLRRGSHARAGPDGEPRLSSRERREERKRKEKAIKPEGPMDPQLYSFVLLYRRNVYRKGGPISYKVRVNGELVRKRLDNNKSILLAFPKADRYELSFSFSVATGPANLNKRVETDFLEPGCLQYFEIAVVGKVLPRTKIWDYGKMLFPVSALDSAVEWTETPLADGSTVVPTHHHTAQRESDDEHEVGETDEGSFSDASDTSDWSSFSSGCDQGARDLDDDPFGPESEQDDNTTDASGDENEKVNHRHHHNGHNNHNGHTTSRKNTKTNTSAQPSTRSTVHGDSKHKRNNTATASHPKARKNSSLSRTAPPNVTLPYGSDSLSSSGGISS